MRARTLKHALLAIGMAGVVSILGGCGDTKESTTVVKPKEPGTEVVVRRVPPNLVIESFQTIAQPQGGITAFGIVSNQGQGRARKRTELRIVKIDEKGKAELLDAVSIKPLIPQEKFVFKTNIAAGKLPVTRNLKLRAICDATRAENETAMGELDNVAELVMEYGPDVVVTGVRRAEVAGKDPVKDPEDGKKITLMPELRNRGNVTCGVNCKWEAYVLDNDLTKCFETQGMIAKGIEKYNLDKNTKTTNLSIIPELVQKGYLSEYPKDPPSDSDESYKHFSWRNEGTGIICSVHGAPDQPKLDAVKDQLKYYELKTFSVDLAPGKISTKEGVLDIEQGAVESKVGRKLAGKNVQFRLTVDPANSTPETDERNNAGGSRYRFPNPPAASELDVWCLIAAWNNKENFIYLITGLRNLGNKDTGAFKSEWSFSTTPWKNDWDPMEKQDPASMIKLTPQLDHKGIKAFCYEDLKDVPIGKWDPKEYAGKTVAFCYEADAGNKVVEFTDKDATPTGNGPNNTMHWNLRLPPERFTPDLAVSGWSHLFEGGRSVCSHVRVYNAGTLESGEFKVTIHNNGHNPLTLNVKNLPPKGWYTPSWKAYPITESQRREGWASVRFAVAPSRPDKSDDNNVHNDRVKVAKGADLAVTDVKIDLRRTATPIKDGAEEDAKTDESMEIVVTGTVTNVGDQPSQPFTFVVGTDNGSSTDGKDEDGMKPQETRVYTHVMKVVEDSWGKKYLGSMSIKPTGTDLHAENNERKSKDTVFLPPRKTDPGPQAKLVIDDLVAFRLDGPKGPIYFRASVTNRGTYRSVGTNFVWWGNWAKDETKPVKEGYISALPPGASGNSDWWGRRTLWLKHAPTANDPAEIRVWCNIDPQNIACPFSAEKVRMLEVSREGSKDEKLPDPKPEVPSPID